MILPKFRANSATLNPTTNATLWPWYQGNPQAALDADGDITISYEGYGVDVQGRIRCTVGSSRLQMSTP